MQCIKKGSTLRIPPKKQKPHACMHACEVGQEFTVAEDGEMLKGFCHWAWNDLNKIIIALMYGANWEQKTDLKGAPTIHCCTDGLRPVIFQLERI